MELYRENQGEQSWLVCKLSENEKLDNFDMGMLGNNEIKGLIHPIYSQIEENRMIKYNITEYISLDEVCENPMTREELSHILCDIVDIIDNLSNYMMTSKNILFDNRYVYQDKGNNTWKLICVPVQGQKPSMDLIRFFKLLLTDIRFERREESGLVGVVLNYLNSVQSIKSEELKKVISNSELPRQEIKIQEKREEDIIPKEKEKEIEYIIPQSNYASLYNQQGMYASSSQEGFYREKSEDVKKKKEKKSWWIFGKKKEKKEKKAKKLGKKEVSTQSNNIGNFNIPGSAGTMIIGEQLKGETGTFIFSEEQKLLPRLIRMKRDEMIVLTKNPFILGRGEILYADYEIKGNGAISSQHIEISWRNNQFYVRDMDSTNGTFVDGVRLSKGQKIAITHQCKIKLADEEFEFLQY